MNIKIIKNIMQVEALIESESREGSYYITEIQDGKYSCSCPDYQKRKNTCKHIKGLIEIIDNEGEV